MANLVGRPETNTAEYFRHAVAHKKTVYKLEAKYKNDGYAFLFKLFEQLGSSEGHCIDLSDADNWDYFVLRSGCSEEMCSKIISDLVAWKKLDKELWEHHKILWYQKFVDGLKPLYQNRKRELPERPKIVSVVETPISIVETNGNGISTVETTAGSDFFSNNPDSIVKYSKEEYSIVSNPITQGEKIGVGGNGQNSNNGVSGKNQNGKTEQPNSQQPPKKVAQKKGSDPILHWEPIKKVFQETYEFVKHRPYAWPKTTGNQDNGHFAQIIEVLEDEAKRLGQEWSEENAVGLAKDFFNKSFSIAWLKKNYSLKNVVAKINEVLAIQAFGLDGNEIVLACEYLFDQSLTVYVEWYKGKNKTEPIVSEFDKQKLRLLIPELRRRSNSDEEFVNGWRNIFANWMKLEPFLQERMDLKDIYTNINRIIHQIKNGKNGTGHATGTNGFHERREATYNRGFEDVYNSLDTRLG